MACPFFMPVARIDNGSWSHPHRLPLGCGWSGHCTAPGHEGESPSSEDLHEYCNLGYAEGCSRMPRERPWDSVRFAARTTDRSAEDGNCLHIRIRYVCERGHLPAEHGCLEYDPATARWEQPHGDPRVQRMADCFLTTYLEKKKREAQPVAS